MSTPAAPTLDQAADRLSGNKRISKSQRGPWRDAMRRLARNKMAMVGLGIIVLFALSAIGLNLSSIAVFAGALGVGVGLGLQGVVKEFVSGIVLLFAHEARVAPNGPGEALIGIALTLCAIMSASTANVLQATETARRYPMVSTLAIAMLIGAGIDAVVAFTLSGPPVIEARPVYFAGILYLGLFGSAIAFTLYFGVLRVIGPAKAAYSSVIVPVIAMLLSTAFEGYRWTWLAVAGGMLTVVGLVIALSARRPAR